jgi:predicted RNA-binding Zn-ribbon protein involved in translation (DUF1610 family)
MMPPQIYLCPECGVTVLWCQNAQVMGLLKTGHAFALVWCPGCNWTVIVPEADDLELEDIWP